MFDVLMKLPDDLGLCYQNGCLSLTQHKLFLKIILKYLLIMRYCVPCKDYILSPGPGDNFRQACYHVDMNINIIR